MIGPRKKKMPDKLICSGCDVVISKEIGGTEKFPKKRVVNYCNHEKLDTQVSFIKGFPYTPKWCPALKQGTQPKNSADSNNAGSCSKCGAPFSSLAFCKCNAGEPLI